jgi:hypothetical protein
MHLSMLLFKKDLEPGRWLLDTRVSCLRLCRANSRELRPQVIHLTLKLILGWHPGKGCRHTTVSDQNLMERCFDHEVE